VQLVEVVTRAILTLISVAACSSSSRLLWQLLPTAAPLQRYTESVGSLPQPTAMAACHNVRTTIKPKFKLL